MEIPRIISAIVMVSARGGGEAAAATAVAVNSAPIRAA
jgi:hypothetical protein